MHGQRKEGSALQTTWIGGAVHRLLVCMLHQSLVIGMGCVMGFSGVQGQAEATEKQAHAYVFNMGSGQVSIIDTDSHKVIKTVDAGLRIRWFSSRFFDGKRIWAVDGDMQKAEVVVFDPRTLNTLQRIPFGKGPALSVELTPDLRYALADAAGSDEVVVIDTASYDIVKRIPTGKFPCDLTLSKDGMLAYEPDRDQDTLSVIDWTKGETPLQVTLEAGSKPHMLTLSPDGATLWVQERETHRVSVYDTATLARRVYLQVGTRPATNEFTPDGRFTIVTHIGDKVVKVFDTATYQEIKTIPVGKGPVNTAFRPDGEYAYITNMGSNTVPVIDTARWEVIKTIPVGTMPFGLYVFAP